MAWLIESYKSALAKKVVMAVTGIILFGFVLGHMVGNLKLYLGPEALNHYAEALRELGAPLLAHGQALWIARIVLLAAVVLHIWSAWTLTLQNRRARPHAYAKKEVIQATYASRTMRWGGVIILLFVVYHLLHLTFGTVHPDFIEGDVYHNVVTGFRVWWVAGFYILANLALGFHLYHGLWSMFQSLGWDHDAYKKARRPFAALFAVLITACNISFPLAVLTGLVTLPA
ncbi:MAG: succinate dehydrogenase cytochrome b subunit [Acidobacteria bacterium]|nr:succinate dehydrogenase cytochrome b subunit [Acidobacteriota bacterium]